MVELLYRPKLNNSYDYKLEQSMLLQTAGKVNNKDENRFETEIRIQIKAFEDLIAIPAIVIPFVPSLSFKGKERLTWSD